MAVEQQWFFPAYYDPSSERIICTPSIFAREHLLYVQETGCIKLLEAKHSTARANLASYLFVACIGGSGTLESKGVCYPVREGECFWIDCRQPHRYFSSSGAPWQLRWVHFNGGNAELYYRLFLQKERPVFQPSHLQAVYRVLTEITAANYCRNPNTDLQNASLLTQLLTLTLVDETAPASAKMRDVRLYLREHYLQKQTLEDLAQRFQISKFYLTHEFKRCFDETIVEYLNALRMNKAKHLLRFSDLRMNEVAEQCGFCDANYFSRSFKKTEGIAPAQYRASWHGKARRASPETLFQNQNNE